MSSKDPAKRREASARYYAKNKDKAKAASEKWVAKNRDKQRWYMIKSEYGITKDQWLAIFDAQGNKCAICKTDDAKWCTDHCHKTGKVRGILCHHCNVGFGHFRDNAARLRAAAEYADRHS